MVMENDGEISVTVLFKGKERYIFLYDDDNRSEMLRTLGRFAHNEDLSFTWYDAACVSKMVREESVAQTKKMSAGGRFAW